jgi:DNA polymerase III subunit epsilon
LRQVVLDTETTGLDPKLGHRVIEIACVELDSRRFTQRHFHRYINPEREIDAGALAVHGITSEFLQDKPLFAQIVDEFLDFVAGAELIIHNAAFDIGFLNSELALLGKDPMKATCPAVCDTLKMAREMFPGKRNNLDALCERLAVDNAHRTLHGALLDAELLAEVYLAMTRGQESLIIETLSAQGSAELALAAGKRGPLRVLRAATEEAELHAGILAKIEKETKGNCLWLAKKAEPSALPA